ncbi:MAG: alpha/beta hydrolase [Bacteroidia bacterium]
MPKIIFRIGFILFLIVIVLYLISVQFSITELIYPVKIDSAFIHNQQFQYEKELSEGKVKAGKIFLYNPLQLGLISEDISIRTNDSILLKGWYVTDSTVTSGTTLILIPDLKESKFNYIESASEFVARGIHVCILDMRAQGESEGRNYTMGKNTTDDVSIIIDSLISKYKTENIVLMGNGTGAAIAIQSCIAEKRIKLLVSQNSLLSMNDYLEKYSEEKYGRFSKLFFDRMKRDLEKEMWFSADSLNLLEFVTCIEIPSLFVSNISENYLDYKSTGKLFRESAASKKEWKVFKNITQGENNLEEKKKYYDKIASFINSNIPKKKKQSKYKKLVYN